MANDINEIEDKSNFLGIRLDGVQPKFEIIQVPYDFTASYGKGAVNGPKAIIEASNFLELFDDELDSEPYKQGIKMGPILDCSDLEPEKMFNMVYDEAEDVISRGMIPVLLGGEHSVSTGIIKAQSEAYDKVSILQFDAHGDLRESFEGYKESHASTMRRALEWADVTQVGIRSFSKEEADFMEDYDGEKRLTTFFATDLIDNVDDCIDEIVGSLNDNVHITFDLDFFDPSIMPSTGTPEPGGFGWYDALRIIKAVSEKKKIVGFDVVELSPVDNIKAPDFMAAKLVYKIMGYISEKMK